MTRYVLHYIATADTLPSYMSENATWLIIRFGLFIILVLLSLSTVVLNSRDW